jgi:hypothetical protein
MNRHAPCAELAVAQENYKAVFAPAQKATALKASLP